MRIRALMGMIVMGTLFVTTQLHAAPKIRTATLEMQPTQKLAERDAGLAEPNSETDPEDGEDEQKISCHRWVLG